MSNRTTSTWARRRAARAVRLILVHEMWRLQMHGYFTGLEWAKDNATAAQTQLAFWRERLARELDLSLKTLVLGRRRK